MRRPSEKSKCPHCPKSFKRPAELARHLRVHTDEKPFKCDQCPQTFTRKHHLLEHSNRHANKKPFKCEICWSAFAHSRSLRRHHEKIHQFSKPRKTVNDASDSKSVPSKKPPKRGWLCVFCKTVVALGGRDSHIRSHIGERPFLCRICDESFTQSSHLYRHRQVHVSAEQDNPPATSSPEKAVSGGTRQVSSDNSTTPVENHPNKCKNKKRRVKWSCAFCSETFLWESALEKHFIRTHMDEQKEQEKEA